MTHTALRSSVLISATLAACCSALGLATTAYAHDEVAARASIGEPAPIRFDAEVDPIAYVARGYSLHVGINWERLRLDLGAFGAQVPEFMHGQTGFEDRMDGYGAKLDVFLLDPSSGPFVGIEGGWLEQHLVDTATQLSADTDAWSLGGRVGWLFNLPGDFFLRPWVGVGHRFGELQVNVGERTFEQSSLLVFPTFHFGYRFD